MTRAERLAKLSHAIMDYRGRMGPDGRWIKGPQRKARTRIARWLQTLGVKNIDFTMQERIDRFKNQKEMQAFLRSL